jgi:nucleoside-diphosphate-sugar epimerase
MGAFETVALFGAGGQIGRNILEALVTCKKTRFKRVVCFDKSASGIALFSDESNVTVKEIDLANVSKAELAKDLEGIQAVVSALNGPALEAQPKIQDAAADAGVKRFYPSEYGMHHIYRKPAGPGSGSDWGYVHPMWDKKSQLNEACLKHPAVDSGAMTYTLIGCGDFYNQDREKTWCPWTQAPEDVGEQYTFHVIGDVDAKVDYTHLYDFAQYLVATLCEPGKSENQELNFPSDRSHQSQ